MSPQEQAILRKVSDCAPKPCSFRHYLDRNIAAKLAGQGYLYTCPGRGEDGEFPYLLAAKAKQEPTTTTLLDVIKANGQLTINNPEDKAAVETLIQQGLVEMIDRDDYGDIVVKPKTEPAPEGVDAILSERQTTYGEYRAVSHVAQSIKGILANAMMHNPALGDFMGYHRESLDMICNKLARIVNGDPNYKDSWDDIAGYATLVSKELNRSK